MCGIFGVISKRSEEISPRRVRVAAQVMAHRGPDAFGQWGEGGTVELAHLRLAIIDLRSDSDQPFISACGRYVLLFNGEIYNYLELRRELAGGGIQFRTESDTEVLLAAYIHWGEACVNRFNGDWAFAIYDRNDRSLFCSRDRFGVKPFNYALLGEALVFSSEIKAILEYAPGLRQPNHNVIANYCRNGLGAQSEETWFRGVKRLQPGCTLRWQDGVVSIRRYWNYPTQCLADITFAEAKDEYKRLFAESVKLRMRSDVPVGATLSAGLDSTSIVSEIREWYDGPLSTFTATFKTETFQRKERTAYRGHVEFDESVIVQNTARNLRMESHLINGVAANFPKELARAIWHLESGHSSPAVVPLARVFDVASKYVTVVLEGQGADELLAGYITNMFPLYLIELTRSGAIAQVWQELAEFSRSYSVPYSAKVFLRLLESKWLERTYHNTTGHNSVFAGPLNEYVRLPQHSGQDGAISERFNRMLCRAHSGGLVNLLHYGDALSMASSMESRLPFMDVNLVEFAFRLPYTFKIWEARGKFIHREAMRGVVAPDILNSPLKLGFSTPLGIHLNGPDAPAARILMSDRCLSRGIFNPEGMAKILSGQANGRRDYSTFLFRLLSTELWYRVYIDGHGTKPFESCFASGEQPVSFDGSRA